MNGLIQDPPTGASLVRQAGDTLDVRLSAPPDLAGSAWLRTNLGRAARRREDLIRHVRAGEPILHHDWHDVRMSRVAPGRFALRLPLTEVGRFEAKAFFLEPGSDEPRWPAGANVFIKVEPADTVCANTLYTAFVRQFGPNREARVERPEHESAMRLLDDAGYTVVPRSGTFRDLIRELDFVTGTLGFRILQLLPIHPVPTTYARMGRFGSPFATLDYWSVDPALAEFDRRTTPLQQFGELLDAVHARGAKLFMDMPINHTGWASRLQTQHPEWFARNADATFISPGAWGVTWQDLSKLDYRHRALWVHIADVFRYWCGHGVDGFRCDAGYMIPVPVWEYIVAEVRAQFPDTLFLLEGLGGPAGAVDALLTTGNLDWGYSELFQKYGRGEIEACVAECARLAAERGLFVHYAETHDNDRLAARSRTWADLRTALAALCSLAGGFGITNGVEWYAAQKLQVHGAAPLAWGSTPNQVARLQRLAALLRRHPAFAAGAHLRLLPGGAAGVIALRRESADHADPVLAVINLSDREPASTEWPSGCLPGAGPFVDLIGGRSVAPPADGRLALAPGEALCLSPDASWIARLDAGREGGDRRAPARVLHQRRLAKVLELRHAWHGFGDVSGLDAAGAAATLADDPEAAAALLAGQTPAPVTRWRWPADARRVVMLPPGHALMIEASAAFAADVRSGADVLYRGASLPAGAERHTLLVPPRAAPPAARLLGLALKVFEAEGVRRVEAELLALPSLAGARVRTRYAAPDAVRLNAYAVRANDAGAMTQVRAAWGTVRSQYDALLAANPHPEYPTDRRVLFTRCRGWLVFRGYSHPLDERCLEWFEAEPAGPVRWGFSVPSGLGKRVPLELTLALDATRNAVALSCRRLRSSGGDHLENDRAVRLILRPDIEDRGMHAKTKAYLGAESAWPRAVRAVPGGFMFAPGGRDALRVCASAGAFRLEPQWTYMVEHPEEAERGLDGSSDVFSPGYFTVPLKGGQSVVLNAGAMPETEPAGAGEAEVAGRRPRTRRGPGDWALMDALRVAMRAFVVRRGAGRTVIAGYPWFLDWGRDTMICLRGLIAAGYLEESKAILREFARFEDRGTLPNLIHGGDASNRDTSDAPLWFFTACADVCAAERSPRFLRTAVGGRRMLEVLEAIAEAYRRGTPNGIRMDPESGLVFSPSHFTWMDTNFPAGTPREGYPIEIQALWHAALQLLAAHRRGGPWDALAARVAQAVAEHYPVRTGAGRYLADCLHARPGQPASAAEADDACRPNQLLALTLGAVTDPALGGDVLRACEDLLVPGAIRSLADRPVARALPVVREGRLLNDPHRPYWGRYEGDEDTRRKPAYHNGTAWTWLFPSYAEAWYRLCGEPVRASAAALLGSAAWIINRDCAGQVPEILDGDAPHRGRGCGAQAWGCTELYRVLALLRN